MKNETAPDIYSNLGAAELVQRLVDAGLDIPPELVAAILVRGNATAEPLGKAMMDEALWQDRGDKGWGPIHAMHLLGGLKSPQALPYFEKFLVPDRNTDWITEDMPAILAAHGPAAMESLQRIAANREAFGYNRNAAVRALCLIAHRHPECQPAVVQFMRSFIKEDTAQNDPEFLDLIYIEVAGLRDPQAMEDLRAAKKAGLFGESPLHWQSMEQTYASKDAPFSIAHDDTDPMDYFSADNLQYLKSINSKTNSAAGAVMTQMPVQRSAPKIGRNQPCPCGSGKKYKKCCGLK